MFPLCASWAQVRTGELIHHDITKELGFFARFKEIRLIDEAA